MAMIWSGSILIVMFFRFLFLSSHLLSPVFLVISNFCPAHIPAVNGSGDTFRLQLEDNSEISSFRCWSEFLILVKMEGGEKVKRDGCSILLTWKILKSRM